MERKIGNSYSRTHEPRLSTLSSPRSSAAAIPDLTPGLLYHPSRARTSLNADVECRGWLDLLSSPRNIWEEVSTNLGLCLYEYIIVQPPPAAPLNFAFIYLCRCNATRCPRFSHRLTRTTALNAHISSCPMGIRSFIQYPGFSSRFRTLSLIALEHPYSSSTASPFHSYHCHHFPLLRLL